MNILVAPDKFRGSLEADEVCLAVKEGILSAFPHADVFTMPLADGGEGTSRILTEQTGGDFLTTRVLDPLGRTVEAVYGISADKQTAFIEMAAASGLHLLSGEEKNPLLTSSFGTGQLILDALNQGVRNIILGIGGSATTDCGIGMAAALGFRFLDQNKKELAPIGASLNAVSQIDITGVDPRIAGLNVTVACDVTNPLYGEAGAAFVYGPQKGADADMVRELDHGLSHFTEVAAHTFKKDVSQTPGAGAAGGLGAGCLWFLNAILKDGVSIVMDYSGITGMIEAADLVITGEGKVDEQTLSGKVVNGLAERCAQLDAPLVVLCGTLQISAGQAKAAGITAAVSVLNRPMDLETAQKDAFALVREATFHMVSLFFSGRNSRI